MIRSLVGVVGASALALSSGAVSAQTVLPDHIYSPVNPLVVEGPASLGPANCYLILTATLDDDTPAHVAIDNYDEIADLQGTNDPAQSDPACAAISVVGGSGTVTGPNSIALDSLLIQVGTNPPCEAAPVAASASNVGTALNVQVSQSTPCGPITADLTSTTPASIQ